MRKIEEFDSINPDPQEIIDCYNAQSSFKEMEDMRRDPERRPNSAITQFFGVENTPEAVSMDILTRRQLTANVLA